MLPKNPPYTPLQRLFPLGPITILVGHYGVGKTNLALNMALDAQNQGQSVSLIDLDIVNPYFRSSDYRSLLDRAHVELIAPTFAGSTLDSPSLSAKIIPALKRATQKNCIIIDGGGDEVGARVLGGFASAIKAHGFSLFFVINAKRNLTQTPEDAFAKLLEIEENARLKATGIINNTHLKDETTLDTIKSSVPFAEETAKLSALELVCTTIPAYLWDKLNTEKGTEPKNSYPCPNISVQNLYVVQPYVHTLWEKESPSQQEKG
jgi:hypothetical protein